MWYNVCGVWHGKSVCDVCTQCVCVSGVVCVCLCLVWCIVYDVCVYIYVLWYVCGMGVCTRVWKRSGHRPGYHRVNVGDVLFGKMAEQPLVIRVALLTAILAACRGLFCTIHMYELAQASQL